MPKHLEEVHLRRTGDNFRDVRGCGSILVEYRKRHNAKVKGIRDKEQEKRNLMKIGHNLNLASFDVALSQS